MGLGDDLNSEVRKILQETWSKRTGQVIPEADDLKLGNDAVILDGTVLYADLDDSTRLVDTKKPFFAAEIYKCYLVCAARIIRSEGGEITSYDGDRVMAVFIGNSKNSSAARTALKINYAVKNIVNPAIKKQYPKTNYSVKHVVGIDTSELFVARTGIRGANDLVWVGRAANYAAKLSARSGPPTQITSDVYDMLHKNSKFGQNGKNMWTSTTAPEIGNKRIYTSTWWWSV
ncbi:MAG: adenylate/guanylate cyclase domain-containing protein [Gemmatimonadetes bacterium]|nr:adenylate/guanylate cyclase domain-containing protein [Gemmatimonadota bacterium]MYG85476.1 adenylate/guanylate cyclase domain-containing protein [Gemmatimonadota bacterium]MYJ88217.1 adenylate/guanylate cyclase domain-containing protein [Gemmatimonadota bacterium]